MRDWYKGRELISNIPSIVTLSYINTLGVTDHRVMEYKINHVDRRLARTQRYAAVRWRTNCR